MSSVFLDEEDLAMLTGRKLRRLQIQWLRTSGIPFFVNAAGRPVVTRAAVEGSSKHTEPASGVLSKWQSRVVAPHQN